MDFLRVLDAVRSITGNRGGDRFPAQPGSLLVIRSDQDGRKVVMVHDAALAKAVLESPAYRQYNFVERILSVAKADRTSWIRRFCDVGLIMIDGPEHERRRQATNELLERCVHRLIGLPPERTAAVLEAAIQKAPGGSAHDVGRVLVVFLFAECIATVTGNDAPPLDETIFEIDFFNPFPTLSTLYRSNEALATCCEAIGVEGLGEAEQATVLSLLVMGVSPLYAMFTAMANETITAVRSGEDPHEAARLARGVDAYSIVATNFVMRECVAENVVGDEMILPGDMVYSFLGSASGCPFTRQTAIPFGAGRHYCSGAKLTSVMLNVAQKAMAAMGERLGSASPSAVVQGKAHAFLAYRGADA
jgi:cytochrome P450